MNVADLAQLAEVASVMRNNGIHRAAFSPEGGVTECELDPKYTPPDPKPKDPTPEDLAVAKNDAIRAKEAFRLQQERLLFMASEGVPDEDLNP